MRLDRERAVVPIAQRLLPAGAPSRRVVGEHGLLDRTCAGRLRQDVAAADEAMRPVVEVVAVVVVDRHSHRAGARIGVHPLVGEERVDIGHGLVGEIPADRAASGGRTS